MGIANLPESLSLDSYWDEVVFTEARLLGDEQAKELAPPFKELLVRFPKTRDEQREAWHEEVSAQAAVAAADDRLDDWVMLLAKSLRHVLNDDRKSPRYTRYFPEAPWSIIRMGLESELTRVRGWIDSLTTEPEKELQDLGTKLRGLVELGDQVLERRRKAAGARNDHRVRSIVVLIDDINHARFSLYGSLTKKAADLGLPRDWPDRFFRHSTRPNKDDTPPPAPPTAK